MDTKKTETTIDSPPEEKLKLLKAVAEQFGSELTRVIGRDVNDQLLHVSVFARGIYAAPLERFLAILSELAEDPEIEEENTDQLFERAIDQLHSGKAHDLSAAENEEDTHS
jgi:hypothetical protein